MTRTEESFQIRRVSYFSVCFLHVAAVGAVCFTASLVQLGDLLGFSHAEDTCRPSEEVKTQLCFKGVA